LAGIFAGLSRLSAARGRAGTVRQTGEIATLAHRQCRITPRLAHAAPIPSAPLLHFANALLLGVQLRQDRREGWSLVFCVLGCCGGSIAVGVRAAALGRHLFRGTWYVCAGHFQR